MVQKAYRPVCEILLVPFKWRSGRRTFAMARKMKITVYMQFSVVVVIW